LACHSRRANHWKRVEDLESRIKELRVAIQLREEIRENDPAEYQTRDLLNTRRELALTLSKNETPEEALEEIDGVVSGFKTHIEQHPDQSTAIASPWSAALSDATLMALKAGESELARQRIEERFRVAEKYLEGSDGEGHRIQTFWAFTGIANDNKGKKIGSSEEIAELYRRALAAIEPLRATPGKLHGGYSSPIAAAEKFLENYNSESPSQSPNGDR
jgi:hypothetical protein